MSELLQDLVSRQAEQRPDATAIVFGDQRWTYGEVERMSNRLAQLLRAQGCGRGDRVALFLPKCPEAIVGMLATLKAGGAYVPIDITSPAPRVVRILRACEPRFALLAQPGAKLLDETLAELDDADAAPTVVALQPGGPAGEHFEIAFDLDAVEAAPDAPLDPVTTADDAAHILFTSGSTGVPKGVVILHRNVIPYVAWVREYFGTQPGERISGHPPLHFDLSTQDIYSTLGSGAELHLVPPALNLVAPRLAGFIRDHELTQWFSVPSILTYLAKFDAVAQDDFPAMRRLLWCGEVLPTPTLIYWMKRLPHVTFTNLYGPTEATIASSYYRVPECPSDERASIPIGEPCAGEELLVLDEKLQPAPTGEVGDLYLRGVGLSPGYWQDPEKTAAVFLPHPEIPDDRIYKTGDLARLGDDGLVYFLGREDSQIKSRGYRIELGEIETALNAFDSLKECAVVGAATAGFEGKAICCAYAPSGEDPTSAVLRRELRKVLPSYMLPARWKRLDVLPKNANGKIDRRRIRESFEEDLAEAGTA